MKLVLYNSFSNLLESHHITSVKQKIYIMMFKQAVATMALLVSYAIENVQGHGHLVMPKPIFINPNSDTTKYVAEINGPTALPGNQYNTSPQDNTKAFTAAFKSSKYKTLKEFIGGAGGVCGYTDPNGTPQDFPQDGIVSWRNGQEGFVSSHEVYFTCLYTIKYSFMILSFFLYRVHVNCGVMINECFKMTTAQEIFLAVI